MSINLCKIFLKIIVNPKKNNWDKSDNLKLEETPDLSTRLDRRNVKYEET
jgi:hypothetical protein